VIAIDASSPVLAEYVGSAVRRYDYVQKLAGCFGARFLLFWQPMWRVETGAVASAVKNQEEKYMIIGKHFSLRHNFQVTNHARRGA